MNVKEMHIGIDLILQKVNSNVVLSFEPEEKDWLLNEEMYRFIKQRTNPLSNSKREGFQETQKRFDDLRPLITPAYIPAFTRTNDSVFGYLPSDYIYLINDRSLVKDLCGLPFTTVSTISANKYVACLKIESDPTNLYQNTFFYLNSTLILNTGDYPQLAGGLPDEDSKFELIWFLLEALRLNGVQAKYEYYADTQCLNGIVVVSDTPFNVSASYNGTDYLYEAVTKPFTKINYSPTIMSEVPNRLTKTEDLYNILANSFSKTLVSSPISTLEKDKIVGFHKQKFILSGFNIDYIRKPKQISLSLGQSCELDEPAQKELVENVAKRLAGLTGSQTYSQIVNENLLNE